jgi:hypothetical protein
MISLRCFALGAADFHDAIEREFCLFAHDFRRRLD